MCSLGESAHTGQQGGEVKLENVLTEHWKAGSNTGALFHLVCPVVSLHL